MEAKEKLQSPFIAWPNESIDDAPRGVLFVHATWSGESLLALSRITSVWREVDGPLFFIDTDRIPAPLRAWLNPLHGRGETFWIRDGRVVERLDDYSGDWAAKVRAWNKRLQVG